MQYLSTDALARMLDMTPELLPWVRNELALWFRRPASFAPADAQDMRRFADALRADPDAAREFFRGAGILDADGRLAPPHAQAVE